MTQRIYWVPHTVCPFGCLHCHNDSAPTGVIGSRQLLSRIITNLPDTTSPYRLEDVVIGGGDGLARDTGMEYLIQAFRERYPQGTQNTADERRAGGNVIVALQTAGPPLADSNGNLVAAKLDQWLDLGVDYFQVASSDMFHRSRHPNYPWDVLEQNMLAYQDATGIEFRIYGKAVTRLVPSGRVLQNLDILQQQGARLLTDERYCADGWETGSRFLSGLPYPYPQCAEVVIDPQGWVHPCCWYLLSPGLFDLTQVSFESGMQALAVNPLCQAIDGGDMLAVAAIAGATAAWTCQVRDVTGDCGLCRLASILMGRREGFAWLKVEPLSAGERAFYAARLDPAILDVVS